MKSHSKLLEYEKQRLDTYKTALYATTIDDETLAFWSSILMDHVVSWNETKMNDEQKKKVKEIRTAVQFIVAYNTTLKMRSDYMLAEVQEFRNNYNKECLKRKELERELAKYKRIVEHYENE